MCFYFISDPPGTPNITGVTSDTILEEGQVKRLTCISMAGNPLADLKWFRYVLHKIMYSSPPCVNCLFFKIKG